MLLTLALLFFALGGHEWLTLEALKRHQEEFAALRGQSPWLIAAGLFLLYVLVAALSLPGAAIMTLAAGALFGLWLGLGLGLVSFASSLGATLAFLVARFLLRDQVQHRFGDRLKAVGYTGRVYGFNG